METRYLNMQRLNELYDKVNRKMDAGDFVGALGLTREIQEVEERFLASDIGANYLMNTGGLLIDIGTALGQREVIDEGVNLIRDNIKLIEEDETCVVSANYNLANGYSSLFQFKRRENPYTACFRDTELEKARTHYKRAIEIGTKDALLMSQIWVNLGNCYDDLGRVIDAAECYEEALRWKHDHGMALGNKGVGLYSYARVVGEHQGTFLIEAYQLISQGLSKGVPVEAVPRFERYMKAIKDRFSGRQHLLDNPSQYPGYKIETTSKFERFLVEFCLKNKLYLNPCNYCQRCNAAIGDTVAIKRMIVPMNKVQSEDTLKNDPYLRLSSYLNQIKQDYITARFLLATSRYNGLNLNFVDKHVKIINTLDYSIHNIYVELVKRSFKSFYDILDKIAFFINDYLRLNMPDTQISFRRIWYKDVRRKDKGIRSGIQDTHNHSLNALFDLHRDLDTGICNYLTRTRNRLTHRFINIRMFRKVENDESMDEDSLVDRTLELAKLVRNAILYLLHFVYIEESKKEKEAKEFIPTIIAWEVPDNLKHFR